MAVGASPEGLPERSLADLYDGLGSVIGTVDPAGNLVSTRKYDVYGAVRWGTGPAGPKHRFVGGLGHPSEEETGLIYMRARYYDPITGRFTSCDSLRTFNRFAYANCNPVNQIDPDGHFSLPADAPAVAEALGMEASQAAGLEAFSSWFQARLAQAVGRHSIKLVVEFVEEGVIEPGLGSGRFLASLEQVTVQLAKQAANPRLLIHELAEAEMWLTGASGMVSDAEAALYSAFLSFL